MAERRTGGEDGARDRPEGAAVRKEALRSLCEHHLAQMEGARLHQCLGAKTRVRMSVAGALRSMTPRAGTGGGDGIGHYGVAAPLALSPALAQVRNPLEVITGVWSSPLLHLALAALGAMVVVFWAALAYWAYKDAARRKYAPLFASALCLLLPFAGVVLYVLLRPPEYALDYEERQLELAVLERELAGGSTQCQTCSASVATTHLYCPHCGSALKRACAECGSALEDGYAYCPACGASGVSQASAAAVSGGRRSAAADGQPQVREQARAAPSSAENGRGRRQ